MRTYFTGSRAHGLWGVRLGRFYVTLASPSWPAVFSERNRLGVRVLPLGGGWRLRLRTDTLSPAGADDGIA